MPKVGIAVDAAPDSEMIRDMIFGHYIARYAVTANAIYSLLIWHHDENRDQKE